MNNALIVCCIGLFILFILNALEIKHLNEFIDDLMKDLEHARCENRKLEAKLQQSKDKG